MKEGKPYKYNVGQAVEIVNDSQWQGAKGRIESVTYKVKIYKKDTTIDFLEYEVMVANNWMHRCSEEQLVAIADEWDEYYDDRFQVKEGHIVELEGKNWIVETAKEITTSYGVSRGRIGETDTVYENHWHIVMRQLNEDGSYNPNGKSKEFNQDGELKIIGKLQKQVDFK